jgi:hypothetical protein
MSFKAIEQMVVDQCNSTMGQDVTYTSSDDSETELKAVFSNAWVHVNGVDSLRPILRISLADLELPPARADGVLIDEVEYRVDEIQPDGFGGTTLILKKV